MDTVSWVFVLGVWLIFFWVVRSAIRGDDNDDYF